VHSLPSPTESSPASRASYGYRSLAFGWLELSEGSGVGALTYAAGGGATILFLRGGFETTGVGVVVVGVVVDKGELL
jgi:hypothetical protein